MEPKVYTLREISTTYGPWIISVKTPIWLIKLVIKQNLKLLQVTLKTKYGPFHNYTITTKHKYDLSAKLLVNTTLLIHIFTNKLYSNEYPLIWKLYVMTS